MTELLDLCKEICRECGGRCCFDFPAYSFNSDGTLYRNRLYNQGTNKLILKLRRDKRTVYNFDHTSEGNWTHPCAYWTKGGCPESKKPKGCKGWICSKIGAILYFDTDPKCGHTNPVQAELEIYKQVRKGWI